MQEKRTNQQAEVNALHKRCITVESEIKLLISDAYSAAESVEHKKCFLHSYITKSNDLRRAKEKDEELQVFKKSLVEKETIIVFS